MNHFSIVALLVALAVAGTMAADKAIEYKTIKVHVVEKSGTMKFSATATTNDDDSKESDNDDNETTAEPTPEATTAAAADTPSRRRRATEEDVTKNEVHFMLQKLTEKNAKGEEIGASTQNVAEFTDVMFTIGEAKNDAMIPYSKNKDGAEIKAVMISYNVALTSGAKVKIDAYIAKEDGNVTLGTGDVTETTMVKEGQIKFSVMIEGWVWCTQAAAKCTTGEGDAAVVEVGAFLDLVVAVQGKGEAAMMEQEAGMSIAFDIGNDNKMYVSKHLKKTSNANTEAWVAMADSYPMSKDLTDGKTEMTMRFPMFEKSMWYDPSVRLNIPGGDGVSGASTLAASLTVLMLTLLAALIRM